MIRLRVFVLFAILCGMVFSASAQDANANNTSIAEQSSLQPTDDPFELTSTAVIAGATLTAIVVSPRPVITMNAQSVEATPISPTITLEPPSTSNDSDSVLMTTLMIFTVFLIALVLLAAIVIRVGRSSNRDTR